MATVTGLTATRMLAIENASVVSGAVNAQGNLILTKKDGSTVNAGAVVGATGATGATGAAGAAGAAGVVGSIWRTGGGPPATSLGVVNDFYLDTQTSNYYEKTGTSVYTLRGTLTGSGGTGGGTSVLTSAFPVTLGVSMSDENTVITATGTKAKFRAPYGFTISSVRISTNTPSSSGNPTVDILNGAGVSIFTTKPSIGGGAGVTALSNLTAVTGSAQSVIDGTKANIADDELLTFNLFTVGTGISGLKCWVNGTRSISSSVLAPAQVTGLTATAPTGISYGATPGQMQLSWNIPSDNGSAISGYKIEGKLASSSSWPATPIVANHGSSSVTVTTFDGTTSLIVGTSYEFRVSAINGIGTGTASASAIATPITIPSIVTSLTASPGNGAITLNWVAPSGVATGGSAITDYVYEYRTGTNTFAAVTHTASSTPGATITGLANGTSYDFRVYAKNSAGTATSFATVSQTPSATLGGTFTLNPVSGNTKYLVGPQGTQSASRVGPATSVQPVFGSMFKVGWQNLGGGSPNFGISSFTMHQGLIDFSLASVTGTVSTVLLQGDLIDSPIYQNANTGRDFTVELYTYNYGTADVNDFVTSVSGMTLLATFPITNAIEPGTGLLMSLDLAGTSGAPLKSAITANIGGNLRILAITNQYRLDSAPASGAGGSDEWVSFNKIAWTLTVTTT